MYALFQAIDVGGQLANRVEALGFAELDVKAILDLTHELNHVERIDTERLERGVGGNGSGVDVEVLVQDFLDGFVRVVISLAFLIVRLSNYICLKREGRKPSSFFS